MKHELSRRQFMQLSAGLASGALLAACAAPVAPAPAGGEAVPSQEAVTITFLALHDGWANVWDAFNEVHPDVTVEADFLPWDAFFEQIQVRLASGSGDPDVYEVDVPLTASYGFREWLIPLDDLFTEDEVNDWVPS